MYPQQEAHVPTGEFDPMNIANLSLEENNVIALLVLSQCKWGFSLYKD